jgi:hypothetical protein
MFLCSTIYLSIRSVRMIQSRVVARIVIESRGRVSRQGTLNNSDRVTPSVLLNSDCVTLGTASTFYNADARIPIV